MSLKGGDAEGSSTIQNRYVVDPHTAEHLDDSLAVFFRGASPS